MLVPISETNQLLIIMIKNLLLYFALLLWFVVPLSAQPAMIFTPNVEATTGEQIEINLQVSNFSNIVGMQFSMNWDATALQLVSIENFNLPGASINNIGLKKSQAGAAIFSWIDNSMAGVSLANDSPIFTLSFKVLAPSNTSTEISISKNETIEVIDVNSKLLDYTLESGMITVINPTSTQTASVLHSGNLSLHQNHPNPFGENTIIQFDISQADTLLFTIYDIKGKKQYESAQHYIAGTHFLKVNKEMLPAKGIYIYELVNANTQNRISGKMIFN